MMRALLIAALFAACSGGGGAQVAQNLPERGELAAAGVTGTTGSNGNTVLTLTRQATCLSMENTLDKEVMIASGTTLIKRVPAYSYRVLDLGTNAVAIPPGSVLKAHLTGASASTGYLEVLTCSSTR
jgi:hypothetical protein